MNDKRNERRGGRKGFIKERKRFTWSENKWGEGYVGNHGRFLVYRPDYPKSTYNGYALRYHVVWWLNTGEVVNFDRPLHHKNGEVLDDRFENLERINKKDHDAIHSKENRLGEYVECLNCGNEVYRQKYKGNISDFKGMFCSRECWFNFRYDK